MLDIKKTAFSRQGIETPFVKLKISHACIFLLAEEFAE